MRSSTWTLLLATLLHTSFGAAKLDASDNASPEKSAQLEERAEPEKIDNSDSSDAATVFNGVKVPPLKDLPGVGFEESIKDGYWFVKHHSPYCPHCIEFAPTWQTLYEFYYTSNPLWESKSKLDPDSDSSLNSFTKYYDFHFASLDCIAFADKCKALGIKAFPTLALYRNGEQFDVYKGKKTMEGLSEYVEQALERIKPGSRPRGKIAVPKPEAKEGQLVLLPGESAAEGSGSDKPAVPETPSVSKTKADDKPRAPANPHGTTVPLSAESFLRLVTATQDPWFIKFYAPWCSHCQALAPAWHQMAKEMKDKLNIGEVNCELEKRLCKDARVNSFPTIYFFRGGERVEYEGLRGLGDLMSFANKASDVVGNGVQYVDAAAFKELEEKEDVVFLYFFDPATTSEDFEALDRLTLSLVGRARLVKTNSTILAERYKITTFPRLLVSRDGRPSYYPPIAPRDMRDFRQVLSWMRTVWLPIVPELTIANAREIMEGKYVVLGILNRQRQSEFVQDKRELKNAALEWMDKQTKLFQLERQELRDAKQLRIEEAADRNDQRAYRAAKNTRITIQEGDKKQVVFAWVDGIFWDRWVRTTYGIDVRNGERVIINDEEFRRYWDTSPNGADILPSRTSILETLSHNYQNPTKLKSKSTIGFFEGIFFSIQTMFSSHPILSVLFLIVFCGGTWLASKSRLRRSRLVSGLWGSGSGGFFHLDGKEGLLGSVGSGGGNGKVD